jgi:hypothetical protein
LLTFQPARKNDFQYSRLALTKVNFARASFTARTSRRFLVKKADVASWRLAACSTLLCRGANQPAIAVSSVSFR